MARNCFNDSKQSVKYRQLAINGRPGYGIQVKPLVSVLPEDEAAASETENLNAADSERNHKSDMCQTSHVPDIVTLDEPACNIKSLVGGKAFNLAISKSSGKYNVPNGFCLTTKAFRQHVSDHEYLRELVAEMNTCLSEMKTNTLKKMRRCC